MSVLICGSLTYDTIMVFNDKFKHHLLPAEPLAGFDIYFVVPDLRRQFGGSAGNIAYSLKILGAEPFPMSAVGMDFGPYAEWLDNHGIQRDYITIIDHSYTAQTFVTIDMDDSLITAFHPGALSFSHYNQVSHTHGMQLGTVSAGAAESMMAHALQFVEAGIPFVFDPGRSIMQFDGDELMKFIEHASWILVNQHEWQLMAKHTGLSPAQIAKRIRALIVTLGAEGALIYTQDTRYQIPAAQAKAVNDMTGCGDAFCAGLLYGLLKDIDWETTGRIATLMGAIKVEHHGSQNHTFTLDLFKARFKKNFGYALIV
ncbi:MAG: carbohydrate kinase family protein [Beggiatoa sp. IS2]|nr:MAG: carbohydrate kinase family protein [Beggiatoa sp. IS2]